MHDRHPETHLREAATGNRSAGGLGDERRTNVREPGKPVRVVFVDHVARLSGAEIALVRLIRALGKSVQAHVILGEDGPLVAELERVGATVQVLEMHPAARDVRKDTVRPGLGRVLPVLRTLAYVVRLTRLLRQLRPDLVHTNSLKACVYGGLAGRLAGVPVVWHVRDRIAEDYLPVSAVRLVRLLSRVLPTAVVANSESTRATLPRARSSSVVYNAVVPDTVEAGARRPRLRDDDALVVGVVGRLASWKGQDVFLRAFAEAFPDGPVQARLIGSAMFGEDAYERSLHELARRLGVAGRVDFRGFRDDVEAELAELDVLVHCSVTPEPFGQVVVEGMAAGLPVVAADAGGPAEIIDDGVDGLLTPPGDVRALAAAMRRLADDPVMRCRLSEAGQLAASRFSPSVTCERLMEAYDRVLNAG